MDPADTPEGRGNAGKTADSLFHLSCPSRLHHLIWRKILTYQPNWCSGLAERQSIWGIRVQIIRHLLIRSGCFRLERELPGGTCTHGTGAPSQGTRLNGVEPQAWLTDGLGRMISGRTKPTNWGGCRPGFGRPSALQPAVLDR